MNSASWRIDFFHYLEKILIIERSSCQTHKNNLVHSAGEIYRKSTHLRSLTIRSILYAGVHIDRAEAISRWKYGSQV